LYRSFDDVYRQPKTIQTAKSETFPRQIEYHPTMPNMMAVGTMSGHILLTDLTKPSSVVKDIDTWHQKNVLGIAWIKSHPSMLIAGLENGNLCMYDFDKADHSRDPKVHQFRSHPRLTSVHVNATDQICASSGYQSIVQVFDVTTGVHLHDINGHDASVNVIKFANLNPNLLLSTSFDQTAKIWDIRDFSRPASVMKCSRSVIMGCFSPDDRFVLTSSSDNEVRQWRTVDGTLDRLFPIPPLCSSQNFTRSYYINKGNYIIVGSCEQPDVMVFNSSTGRQLTSVSIHAPSFSSCCLYLSLFIPQPLASLMIDD